MHRHAVTFIFVLSLLLIHCRPFISYKNEAERIRKEAQQLYDDANKLLPSSIRNAAEVGLTAVDEALGIALDPRAVRFAAVSTATMLADEAVKTVIMRQAKKFDRIFGADHSEAVCSMLLNTYCYPILNEILVAAIDRRLARIDSSFTGDTTALPLDTIITMKLAAFNLENAVNVIKGFGTGNNTPDYYRAVDMHPVNTATYAVTRNWKDLGLVYQFRISNDQLDMKCSDRPWQPLPLPGGQVPRMVAADNNRAFVLTVDNQLWWYCIKDDQAQWSIDIMETAVEVMALKPVVGNEVCGILLPHLIRITDSTVVKATAAGYIKEWKGLHFPGSKAYWEEKCTAWTDVALSLDKMLLKTGDGVSFTAQDYADWSRRAHREGTWSELLSWTGRDLIFYRGLNVPVDSIVDIAVGNWNGTVATMYILASGKIWFIDEEIIHPEWKPIENWNEKWALLAKEYHPIEHAPYPLDTSCRIDASNSVIAVSKNTGTESTISWVRWDYHQKDDFIYWPLDWCEHAWYTVTCPSLATGDFRISTIGGIDPRESNTVWSVPAPAFTFHNYLPAEGYQGIFGDVPREQVSTYPVELFVADVTDSVEVFSLQQTRMLRAGKGRWEREKRF
jgi:hypothetical protein